MNFSFITAGRKIPFPLPLFHPSFRPFPFTPGEIRREVIYRRFKEGGTRMQISSTQASLRLSFSLSSLLEKRKSAVRRAKAKRLRQKEKAKEQAIHCLTPIYLPGGLGDRRRGQAGGSPRSSGNETEASLLKRISIFLFLHHTRTVYNVSRRGARLMRKGRARRTSVLKKQDNKQEKKDTFLVLILTLAVHVSFFNSVPLYCSFGR